MAIENGFYGLKNIKLALEQSLIRTRGCLNLKDVVPCWFRGKRFDLIVSEVIPSTVEAVSCVNTDVEVDIAAVDVDEKSDETSKALVSTASAGYRLLDNTVNVNAESKIDNPDVDGTVQRQLNLKLPTEPSEHSSNVITIQTRGERGKVASKKTLNNYGARIVYSTKGGDTRSILTQILLELLKKQPWTTCLSFICIVG